MTSSFLAFYAFPWEIFRTLLLRDYLFLPFLVYLVLYVTKKDRFGNFFAFFFRYVCTSSTCLPSIKAPLSMRTSPSF